MQFKIHEICYMNRELVKVDIPACFLRVGILSVQSAIFIPTEINCS